MPDAPPAAVIFDFDGVIVDSEGLWYRAYSQVLAEFGVAVTREVYAREWVALGRGPEYACATYPQITISPDEMRRRRSPIVRDLVLAEAALLPGVEAALERLAAAFPVALATNSAAALVDPVLAKFGLRERFAEVVTLECYARPKPAPDAFLAAAAALGVAPERCVVVEDAEKGVVAAHAAGARCVAVPNWWTRDNDFSTADRVVASLDDVTPALVATVLAESPLRVRPATDADRPGIHAAHVASIRELCSRDYPPEVIDVWAGDRSPERIPLATRRYVVAEDAEGIAGFGAADPDEVGAVFVHPRRAGRGVGVRILSALERMLRESGTVEAFLHASRNAVRFYERHGWVRGADAVHVRNGCEIACVRMTKRLAR